MFKTKKYFIIGVVVVFLFLISVSINTSMLHTGEIVYDEQIGNGNLETGDTTDWTIDVDDYGEVTVASEYKNNGEYGVRLYCTASASPANVDYDHARMYQTADLSDIDELIFDLNMVQITLSGTGEGHFKVYVNSDEVYSATVTNNVWEPITIDISSYTGNNEIKFEVYAAEPSDIDFGSAAVEVYLDNIKATKEMAIDLQNPEFVSTTPNSSITLNAEDISTISAMDITLSATTNDVYNNKWLLDNEIQEWDNSTDSPTYIFSQESIGTYNVSLISYNTYDSSYNATTTWTISITNSLTGETEYVVRPYIIKSEETSIIEETPISSMTDDTNVNMSKISEKFTPINVLLIIGIVFLISIVFYRKKP